MRLVLKRKGARTLKIPTVLPLAKSYAYGVRLLFDTAREGAASSFEENLAKEISEAARRRGAAYKKKEALCKEYIENKINTRFLR